MSDEKIFVGRKAELEQFKKVLEDPQGQAILVVGSRGMGKTWLINKMAELADNNPYLKCGCVRYEVTPTDSVGSTIALMMDDAYEAGRSLKEGIKVTGRNKEMWKALISVAKVIGGTRAKALGELVLSFQRDKAKITRVQFLDALTVLSKRLAENARAVFIIDPEKYMQERSASDWRIVVKQLPEKIKLIFAQRTEDVLVKSKALTSLENVMLIPQNYIGSLTETEVQELVRLRARGVGKPGKVLCDAVERYEGHPYAIQAALDIVKKTKTVEDLPQDPTPSSIADTQWEQVCASGDDAIKLFEAYAILEVGVPDDIVQAVSGLNSTARKRLQKDSFLIGLLREEGYGKQIYHAILSDHINDQIDDVEKKEYHSRAAYVYREKLKAAAKVYTVPNALEATRLAEHALVAEGELAFVRALVEESTVPLMNLGLLDAAMELSRRALEMIKESSAIKAMVIGNIGCIQRIRGELAKAEHMHIKALYTMTKFGLSEGMAIEYNRLGLTYRIWGNLDKAEQMHQNALEIETKLGRIEGMATEYGNLGLIYQTRGDFQKAEQFHLRSLEIAQKAGVLEGMANQYGNLGIIYMNKGDLDKAEQMHQNALEIETKLGRIEGIAAEYGNLGLIYHKKGDLDKAMRMHQKALEIEKKLGRLEGMARDYGNLGGVYQMQGDLDKSQQMHLASLQINEKLGRLEGIASDYGNLGVICLTRNDLHEAERQFLKSLEINKKLERLEGMAYQYANLGLVYKKRSDLEKTREYCEKALELFKQMGMKSEIEKTQGFLNTLNTNKGG